MVTKNVLLVFLFQSWISKYKQKHCNQETQLRLLFSENERFSVHALAEVRFLTENPLSTEKNAKFYATISNSPIISEVHIHEEHQDV